MANPGEFIFRGLVERGYSPVHAAALAGHAVQESGGNPSALNQKEGAFGLLQWRLDRRENLQRFAKERGTDPSDPNLQLDFIAREMGGPEAKAGAKFAAAADLPSASAALKSYIRFGDRSDETRLSNARQLLGGKPLPAAPSQVAEKPAAAPMGLAPASADEGMAALIDAAQRIAASTHEREQLPSALPPMRLGEFPMLNALRTSRGLT